MNQARDLAAPLVVVMGVSGCGKSTVGRLLATRLNAEFVEGDELHPSDNVARMAAGVPLTDDDRRAWLLTLAQCLASAHAAGRPLVVSCSALKRSYRELLRSAANELAFVHLHGDPAMLEARMSARVAHFMPPSLLASQLRTLEMPGADERVVSFDAGLPPTLIAAQAAAWLASPPTTAAP
jgi:carbohydrate kinase (thermoresistant glucokinase family)